VSRHGFALVAVLWAIALLSGVAGLGTAGIRLGQRTTMNRIAMIRGRWAAEGCLAIAERRAAGGAVADTATIDLGRSVTCSWRITRPDALLDINTAPRDVLVRLATGRGVALDSASRFADAIVAGRRAQPFTDVRQVSTVVASQSGMLTYLTVDGSGLVDVSAASSAVLGSLPGLSPEASEMIVRRRDVGSPIGSVDELAGALSPEGRAALLARYGDLAPMITFASHRLVVTVEGWVASYGRHPAATLEAVVERLPVRLAVLRRRVW
jgi:hypothetical protein